MDRYILMHKDVEVLEMELHDLGFQIIKIIKIFNLEHVPVGVSKIKKSVDRTALNEWWTGRSIPASRMGIRDVLFTLNISTTMKLVEAAYGLSLSDQYWIKSKNADLNWMDINFFDNEFSEDVGELLFGHNKKSLSLISPDNTSDGWLKKKWKIVDEKRCLIKAGSGPYRQEPVNEVIASLIAKKLGIYHIPYSIFKIDSEPYSICDNFITPKTEYIAAWDFMKNEKKENHISIYKHYLNCSEKYGIKNMQEFLDKMIVLDYIMGNEDRHFGNFGVIRNVETLEYIGPAPIFDTGTALYLNEPTSHINSTTKITCKPFKKIHKEQIKLVSSFEWLEFEKLDNIEKEIMDIFALSTYIEESRAKVLVESIRNKIEELKLISINHLAEDNIEYDLEINIKYHGNN